MSVPKTMAALAAAVGCDTYPQRWDALFAEVLEAYRTQGCVYVQPDYYTELNRKYGVLSSELALYRQAASAVAEDENLTVFLLVLCRALQDRQFHKEDMEQFSRPKKEGSFAHDMLTALAAASEADMCYELLTQRGLPQDVIESVMRMPEGGVANYRKRHGGRPGYNLLDWNQLAIDGKLYRIGRLEYEIFAPFQGQIRVFENPEAQRVALADNIALHSCGMALGSAGYEDADGAWTATVTETEEFWTGYPVRQDGTVENRQVKLLKACWKCVLAPGDPVVRVHIPAGGGLSPDVVDDSLAQAKQFFSDYFPEYRYQAFTCHSWLMDPQLQTLVGRQSNIGMFNCRFAVSPVKSSGKGVFNFVFHRPDMNFQIAELPGNTKLEQALKEHYLSGKYIYELIGYFF